MDAPIDYFIVKSHILTMDSRYKSECVPGLNGDGGLHTMGEIMDLSNKRFTHKFLSLSTRVY